MCAAPSSAAANEPGTSADLLWLGAAELARAIGQGRCTSTEVVEAHIARIEEVNVANLIGQEHNMPPYLYALWIQNRTRKYVLWHPLAETKLAEAVASAAE